MAKTTPVTVEAAIPVLQAIQNLRPGGRAPRLAIRIFNPGGMSGHNTVDVGAIHTGIDWDAGKAILEPVVPLTKLTPEQVQAIQDSVRAGTSWHAYEQQKALRERIQQLEAQIEELLGTQASPNK